MSATLERVRHLAVQGDVQVSRHGYNELAADDIFVADVLAGVGSALVVEDYPDHPRGPCVLALQMDGEGRAIHVVWGIPKGRAAPAVVVTAYRPDPERWTEGYTTRKE